jgi:tripartite-type tricarboxylate transporter receptor subunit TctC
MRPSRASGAWRLGRVLVLLAVAVAWWRPACAEDPATRYPARTIRIVVGFSPGGGNDILARLVGQKLSESLGQPVVIENKPGASAIIISMMASFPLFLVVNAAAPHRTVQELVDYAKANPAKSNYASSSTAFQLPTELFKLRTGAPFEHIGYRGSGDSLVALISGTVNMAFIDASPVSGQIKANQVRALAVTSRERAPEFPDVPTMAEAGVPDMEIALWSGLFAPAGTPAPIVRKLQDEVMRIARLPDVRARMKDLAVEPEGSTSEELARVIRQDIERWSAVAKEANVRIEP